MGKENSTANDLLEVAASTPDIGVLEYYLLLGCSRHALLPECMLSLEDNFDVTQNKPDNSP
jgi:hypothetical protein